MLYYNKCAYSVPISNPAESPTKSSSHSILKEKVPPSGTKSTTMECGIPVLYPMNYSSTHTSTPLCASTTTK